MGEITIRHCEVEIKSIELQLVRVESCTYMEGEAREATEIQNIQIAVFTLHHARISWLECVACARGLHMYEYDFMSPCCAQLNNPSPHSFRLIFRMVILCEDLQFPYIWCFLAFSHVLLLSASR